MPVALDVVDIQTVTKLLDECSYNRDSLQVRLKVGSNWPLE